MRIDDATVQELIENDGCRRGSRPVRVGPEVVIRLCHDLQDARQEIVRLRSLISQVTGNMSGLAVATDREATRICPGFRPSNPLDHKSPRKRAKKK